MPPEAKKHRRRHALFSARRPTPITLDSHQDSLLFPFEKIEWQTVRPIIPPLNPVSNRDPLAPRGREREPEGRAARVRCCLPAGNDRVYNLRKEQNTMGREMEVRGHSRWIKPAALPRETGRRKGIPSILKEAPAEEWDTITVRRSTGTTSHSLLFQISTRQFAVVKLYFICARGLSPSHSLLRASATICQLFGAQLWEFEFRGNSNIWNQRC